MSNLSAALNALASTSVMDFYRPFALRRDPNQPERHFLQMARRATLVWAMILVLVGLVARHWGSVLEAGLTIASITTELPSLDEVFLSLTGHRASAPQDSVPTHNREEVAV